MSDEYYRPKGQPLPPPIGCLGMPVNTPVTPPQHPAEPVQEPVAWRYSVQPQVLGASYWAFSETKDVPDAQPLYTAPPKRKPLTEEEIEEIARDLPLLHMQAERGSVAVIFARAVERAHGIGE